MILVKALKANKKDTFISTIDTHKKIIYKIVNSYCQNMEDRKDLAQPPNDHDVNLAIENVQNIIDCLKSSTPSIPLIHSFRRVPFVTERIYVLEEQNHSLSEDIDTFCSKLLENKVYLG